MKIMMQLSGKVLNHNNLNFFLFSLVFLRSNKDLEKLILCWELIMFLSFLMYCTKHDGIQSLIRKIQTCLERHFHSVGQLQSPFPQCCVNFAITGSLWHVSLQENHRLLRLCGKCWTTFSFLPFLRSWEWVLSVLIWAL